MAIVIESPELESAVAQFALKTGQDGGFVVEKAAKDGLAQMERVEAMLAKIRAIHEKYRHLPVLDTRSADEILGYDEDGLPS